MLLKSTTTGLLLVSTTLSLIEIRKMGFLPQRHIETAARELQGSTETERGRARCDDRRFGVTLA